MLKTKIKIIILSTLGLVAAPFAASAGTSPANVSNTTTINASITATIAISPSTSTVSLALAPTSSTVESAASNTVTVTTNDASGYNLTLIDADTTTALTQTTPAATFTASTGTAATVATAAPVVLTANTWGYHIDAWAASGTGVIESSVAPSAIKWAGVQPSSGSADQLASPTAANAPSGTALVIWWGAQANTSQPSGTGYSDIVTFTATGK